MIDKDGFDRPEVFDGTNLEIKNDKRKIKFDDKYSYRPRNIFLRTWSWIFRSVALVVFYPFMILRYHMHTFGVKHRKKLRGKPFIMTCNHVHVFDDMSVGSNIFPMRKIYFTTLSRNIRRPVIGFFLRTLGGIPVPAESLAGMKKFNEDISYLLGHNKPVLYNPEAALWPYYREIRPYKRGAFSMAVKNNVPVLPLIALFKRKQKRNGKFKYFMYFAMCAPVYPDESLPERERIEKLTEQVYQTSKQVAEEWYKIQDCGFGDEKVKRKLKANKTLFFENDKWVVKSEN